jgi:hypothetical protein
MIRLGLAFVWTSATIIMLLVISALIVAQPHFPLDLGVIKTNGLTGLAATLLPAVAGIAGMILFFRPARRLGAHLLGGYSAFWALIFLSGLPAVWNARRSFCLKSLNFCIISPWVARLTVLSIVLPFALASVVFFAATLQRAPHRSQTIVT